MNTNVEEKYFRVCAVIDLDAIYDNIVNLKKNLKEGTKVSAVVKSDGYGHGAVCVARTVDDIVDSFAVATIDEGVELRNNKIDKPIYILGYTHDSQMKRACEFEIRPAIYTYEMAKAASDAAVSLKKDIKIHLKVDTGMGRIGFKDNDESVEVIKKISKLPNVVIEGIFTHFATADEKDKDKTYKQMERFKNFIAKLENEGIKIAIKHCSNSAAMMEIKDANMDNVRAGIAMYGLYPSDEVDKNSVKLRPALSLVSHVTFVKDIDEGTPISYGGTFVAEKKMRVATVPVGYGDGYRRSLSNKGYVLINGKKAHILGRVCMDQFMVDVSDIEGVKIGDKVTLIGKNKDENISVEEMAEIAKDTFNYEIICDLGKRIPRVYYRNGRIVGTKDYFSDIMDISF